MKLEYAVEIVNNARIIGMIVQAFIEMIDEQPNVRVYDYELKFKDYNDNHHKTLLPAPVLPRDKEQAENVIRRVVQDSVSSFANFLLQSDIVLGEPDSIEITYGIPEPGIDDSPGVEYNMRATLHVTWKSKQDQKLSSKNDGLNEEVIK